MNVNVRFFDSALLRTYIENSSILEQGIRYAQLVTPGISREVARETAIKLAIDRCKMKWQLHDRYLDASDVFDELVQDVKEKRFFDTTKYDKEAQKKKEAAEDQAKRREKERKRVEDLKEYCAKNGLNFITENNKAKKKLKIRNAIAMSLYVVGFLAIIPCGLQALIASADKYMIAGLVGVGASIALWILGACIDPGLPDNFS